MPNRPEVTVLLATYNGERYLVEQLDSIIQQKNTDVKIIVSDDGSTDQTLNILKDYPIEIHQGPKNGFAANFFHLFQKADESSEYYAFSDQDDLWELDKLQRATEWLATIASDKPALYCARTLLVDEQLTPLGHSPLFKKTPGFLNALVQNIAGGNTMVFNQAAYKLLRQTSNKHGVFAHDWWAYLLISGAGGAIFYDPIPSLHYRQHQANLLGNNMSFRARYDRVRMLFQGHLKQWITKNNNNLLDVAHLLTPQHRRQLELFESSRHRWLAPRLINMLRLGIHRQTRLTQIGLLLGIACNKI
jgi:glycosyltransferase involved in cell wall biosynthesis